METTIDTIAAPSTVRQSVWRDQLTGFKRQMRQEQVSDAMRGLAALTASGVPLTSALETLAKHTQEDRLRPVLRAIAGDVASGKRFAEGLSQHPDWFSETCVSVIEAAERSSRVDRGLEYAAEMLENDAASRGRILNAAAYPIVLVGMGVGVVALMAAVVIPSFTSSATQAGVTLTGNAALIARAAAWLTSPFGIGCAAALVAAPLIALALAHKHTPLALSRRIAAMPILGRLIMLRETSRVADMLRLMVDAGVPLHQALRLAARATENPYVAEAVKSMHANLTQGLRMAEALRGFERLPGQFVEMFAIGEEAGRLPSMLTHASRAAARELNNAVERLPAVFQPVALLIIGVFVVATTIGFLVPYLDVLMSLSHAT